MAHEDVSYQLEVKDEASGVTRLPYSGKDTKWTEQNLKPNTVYSFRVQQRINGIEGSWSTPIRIRTEELGIPQNFMVEAIGSEQVRALWKKPKFAVSYHLEMKKKIEADFREVYKGNALSYTNDTLNPGTEYSFRIRAEFEGKMYSSWSKEFVVVTKPSKIIQKLPQKYAWKRCPEGF